MGVVQVLNKGYSKSADVMKLLRRLTLVAATHNFTYSSRWVTGCGNEKADALSRFQFVKFRSLAPDMQDTPCQIPCTIMFRWMAQGLITLNVHWWQELEILMLQEWKLSILFCLMNNAPSIFTTSWLPGEEFLVYFVTHCVFSLGLAYITKKTYLASIRNFYIERGLCNPFLDFKGLSMLQLELILKSLHVVLDGKLFGSYKDILIKAAFSLAFSGFLRCGEFTTYCNAFDPDCNLCLGDITFEFSKDQSVAMQLFLRASKTDPLRQGCTIRYFSVDGVSCPVKSLYKFLQLRLQLNREPHSPLFMLPDGAPLTRGFFLDMLSTACQQAGFCHKGFSGHSFWIGAATVCARKKCCGTSYSNYGSMEQ